MARTGWRNAAREFALIVAGVLAALAGQSWWEDRQDRVLERRYLQSLAADLRLDLAEFELAIRRNEANDRNGHLILQAVQPTSGPFHADSLAVSIERAGYVYRASVNSYTFDELRSTGGLQLLRDFSLKRRIAEYYAIVESVSQWDSGYDQERLLYRQIARGILTSEVRVKARAGERLGLSVSDGDQLLRLLRNRAGLADQVHELIYIRQRKTQDHLRLHREAQSLLQRLERAAPSSPGG